MKEVTVFFDIKEEDEHQTSGYFTMTPEEFAEVTGSFVSEELTFAQQQKLLTFNFSACEKKAIDGNWFWVDCERLCRVDICEESE